MTALFNEASLVGRKPLLFARSPHWTTVLATAVILLIVLMALFAPLVVPSSPDELNAAMRLQPASSAHWMGTDTYGRDLFARVVFGGRVSLLIGAGATTTALAFGLPLGLLAGYFPMADAILMRVMDGLMSIPGILLAIAIVALVHAGVVTLMIAIMIPEIPQVVRLVRSRVLATRSDSYIDAAVLLGTSTTKIILRHLMPATFAPLIVQGTYIYASAILTEAALSFLGVGISTEIPSWGNIMAEGRLYFALSPWLVYWPAIALSLCILSINLLGDALRDRLDPRMKGREH